MSFVVAADGKRIWYEIAGEGEPLVLVGGSSLVHRQWDFLAPLLRKDFRVILFDQRGAGLSDRPHSGVTLEQWADDLKLILDREGIRRAHLFGTSNGTFIVIRFAAKYPQYTGAIIHYGYFRPTEVAKKIGKIGARICDEFGVGNGGMGAYFLVRLFGMPSSHEAWEVACFEENLHPEAWKSMHVALDVDLSDQLDRLTGPQMILIGDSGPIGKDSAFGAGWKEVQRRCPGVEVSVIQGAEGTYCVVTHPDEVVKAVTRFLGRHPLNAGNSQGTTAPASPDSEGCLQGVMERDDRASQPHQGNGTAKVNLIVRAGILVPAYDERPIAEGAVAVSGNRIVAVGRYAELARRFPDADTLGGPDDLLIPGLINGHSHGRGLTDFQRGALDNTLESWMFDTRKYLPVATYDDVAYSAARLLQSGVTATMHNHILARPAQYEREFSDALKAYRDAGLRVQFNPAIRNRNPFVYGDHRALLDRLPEECRRRLLETPSAGALTDALFVPFVSDLHRSHDSDMVRIGFGPLAPQWCTDALLQEIRAASDRLGAPVHIHAIQSIFQKIYGLEALGKTLVRHMHDIGFLGERVVIGHGVWPTQEDIEILRDTGTGITHHPSCNLRVRNGIAPAYSMIQAGVKVGLGLDGKSINDDDDMLQEMKVCFLLHRLASLELDSPCLTARQVFRMATETNAQLLGFGGKLGRLAPGFLADLVLLDYRAMCHPYVDPLQDPVDVLLYRATGRHVHSVIVDGRLAVRDGRVLGIDEAAVGERLAAAASRPRSASELEFARTMDLLHAQVRDYYAGWSGRLDVFPYFSVNSRQDGLKVGPAEGLSR